MFSELVDKIVAETHRGDKRHSIVCSLNDTIQRIHAKANFDRDNREMRSDNLMPDCKLILPRPRDFRKMKFATINGDLKRQPEFVTMSSKVSRMDWDYYYYADESFIFCGQGIQFVTWMYLQKPPQFQYYIEGERPARWCPDANRGEGAWEYLTPDGKAYAIGTGKPENEHWARYKVTDWLLDEYPTVLFWGAINQLYSLTDDEQLKRNSYAMFQTGLADILRDNVSSDISF